MKKWVIGIIVLTMVSLTGLGYSIMGWGQPDNVYYVDINHPAAEDSLDHGHIDRPWQTLPYAMQQLQPGDTLLVREGIYPGAAIRLDAQRSGTAQAPITIKPYPQEQVIWRSAEQAALTFAGTEWWIIEGLIFEGQRLLLGEGMNTIARHIIIRECLFRDGYTTSLRLWYAEDILVENCHFQRIQSLEVGEDVSAITIPFYAQTIVIRNSKFEDISSDGIHLGNRGIRIKNIIIEQNEFWVNNPDTVFLGENGVDVKLVQGPIHIRGNMIHGFRPTVPSQNASGSNGEGIVIHNNAQNVILEKNLFYDNTTHLVIAQGRVGVPGGTRNIVVSNNIFKEARSNKRSGVRRGGYALRVTRAAQVEVYHNTFYDNEIYLRSYVVTTGTFKNNIIFKGRERVNKSTSDWQADYNAWSQIEGDVPLLLRGSHDLITANLNLGADLRPLPNSPVINASQVKILAEDFDGHPRADGASDLGAFEYAVSR